MHIITDLVPDRQRIGNMHIIIGDEARGYGTGDRAERTRGKSSK